MSNASEGVDLVTGEDFTAEAIDGRTSSIDGE